MLVELVKKPTALITNLGSLKCDIRAHISFIHHKESRLISFLNAYFQVFNLIPGDKNKLEYHTELLLVSGIHNLTDYNLDLLQKVIKAILVYTPNPKKTFLLHIFNTSSA